MHIQNCKNSKLNTPKTKTITFIHSLNNYTGSPNILSLVAKGFIKKGYNVRIITSKGNGFLSNISGAHYKYTCYSWRRSSFLTLFLLIISQIQLFWMVLVAPKKNTVYYINTIIPFGAALACWLSRKNYIHHIHENMRQNKPLYFFLRSVYRFTNHKSIFVSDYLKNTAVNSKKNLVVYNGLDKLFRQEAQENLKYRRQNTNILMISSLRRFKGVYEFVKLAKKMSSLNFQLVLSTSSQDVITFEKEIGSISNLKVFPTQRNLHPFYTNARLLLQLSHPKTCTETFGMTILEAMIYGLPAIVPNAGGPIELIDDGINGFHVNPLNLEVVESKIKLLMKSESTYIKFSEAALIKSEKFHAETMLEKIEKFIFE